MRFKKWAWLGQWTAVIVVSVGIGIEVAMHANIGMILITVGSIIFAIATKLRRF